MPIPAILDGHLTLPVIGSPMFIVSTPELVIAQCKAGIVGSFPALNARPKEQLAVWLERITTELAAYQAAHPQKKVAPFAVNQIVHASNDRLMHDMETCVRFKVPIIITSLRPPGEIIEAAHSYGGIVLHDVINVRHARKAAEAGVDGLILVCTGAGGHAGTLSPFALLPEVRKFFDKTIVLAGAISSGASVLAAQAIGADLAYMGTRFIAVKGGERERGLQADDHQVGRGRHRLHRPLFRHQRQLPQAQRAADRPRPGQPAAAGQEQDELRLGRRQPAQGLARHLERGAGRGPDRRHSRAPPSWWSGCGASTTPRARASRWDHGPPFPGKHRAVVFLGRSMPPFLRLRCFTPFYPWPGLYL